MLLTVVMSVSNENITIHTKKFYRVVLVDLDSARETPGSFALKLSISTRTPIQRAKQIAGSIPFVLKSNLTAAEANRLKSAIENIGGVARLESHFVTPGEEATNGRASSGKATRTRATATVRCPCCQWETKSGAAQCPMCLWKFRDSQRGTKSLRERLPGENPLEPPGDFGVASLQKLREFVKNHQLHILAGIIFFLVFIALLK